MQINRAGSQPSAKGPSEYFTGTVRVDPLFERKNPARVTGGDGNLRTLRSFGVAYASAGPDSDRDAWLRARPALGQSS